MEFVVRYVSQEGRIVNAKVEAENADDAVAKVYEEDAQFNSGDNIAKIIDVS